MSSDQTTYLSQFSPLFSHHKTKKSSDLLLSRREAAKYLGITESTLSVWACTKRYSLPYVKLGRLAKYRLSDLDAFIERRTITQQDI